MPANAGSLALTDNYRNSLLALRQQATHAIARLWGLLDPEHLDEGAADFHVAAATTVEAVKLRGVTQADAYLAAYLRSETGKAHAPRGVDPEAYMDTEDGRPLAKALVGGYVTAKVLMPQYGPATAMQQGLSRLSRIVAGEVLGAPRRALHDLVRDTDEVSGWRRATAPNPCGACLALADGNVHDADDPIRVHWHCRCVTEPVVIGVRDVHRRPTGQTIFDALSREQQAALFAGRGGDEKADLIRSGAVPLAALVNDQVQAVGPPTFTEASLSALRTQAAPATG